MATYLGGGRIQEFLSSGSFDVGGTISTYVAGTSTHRATYPTIADAIAQTNAYPDWPLVLDSKGMKIAAINGPTDVIYTSSAVAIIYTIYGLDASSYNVYDSAGNLLLDFEETASAVNYLKITNAASGQNPSIKSEGSEDNIGFVVSSKAAGDILVDGGATGKVLINSVATGNIELWRPTICKQTLAVTGNSTLTGTLGVTGATNLTSLTTTGTTTVNKLVLSNVTESFNLFPAGVILPFAHSTGVLGWSLCNGAAVSRTGFPALFAAIGTTWGAGDGSTTFNLPNLNGRTLVGSDGTSDAVLGASVGNLGGTRTHTLITAEMPAHTHTHYLAGAAAGAASGGGVSALTTNIASAGTTDNTGGNGAHNNIQPSAIISYRIRVW
jgi:microcystin-dependent protein